MLERSKIIPFQSFSDATLEELIDLMDTFDILVGPNLVLLTLQYIKYHLVIVVNVVIQQSKTSVLCKTKMRRTCVPEDRLTIQLMQIGLLGFPYLAALEFVSPLFEYVCMCILIDNIECN